MCVSYGNTGCGVFKWEGTKLERFLHKNQHIQRKLLNYELWINGELSKIGHHFRNKVIQKLVTRKVHMIFDTENLLLGKNISNFVSPVWKLHNPYCNTVPLRRRLRALIAILHWIKSWPISLRRLSPSHGVIKLLWYFLVNSSRSDLRIDRFCKISVKIPRRVAASNFI